MVSGIGSFGAESFEADISAAPFSGAGVDEEGAAAALLSDAPVEAGSAALVVGTGAATEAEADDDASTADGVSEEDAMTSDDEGGSGAGCVRQFRC